MVLILRGSTSMRGKRAKLLGIEDGKLRLEGVSTLVSPIAVEFGEEEWEVIKEYPEIMGNFELRTRFNRYYFMPKKNEVSKRPL